MTNCQQRLAGLAFLAAAGASLSGACASAAQPAPAGAFVQAAQKPNGSGINVRYRILDKPAVGQPVRVEIILSNAQASGGSTVRFTVDPDLRLEGDAGTQSHLVAGEQTTLTVTVVPQAQGLAYLNVFTTQRGLTGSTSIPIQTGAASSSKPGAGNLKETPDGEKILVMPVK